MNIEYASTIPLRDILGKMGLQPAQQNNRLLLYRSPFQDPDSLFQINTEDNTWCDNASQTGGGPIEFVRAYLAHRGKPCTLSDALHWLKFNIGYPSLLAGIQLPEDEHQPGEYQFRFKTLLLEKGLIRYIENRGIPVALARQFLKQVYIRNKTTGKEFLALGLKNEDGGYAIHSPFITTHLVPQAITFIRGTPGTGGVRIFLTVFDFLTAVTGRDGTLFTEDSIILNSYQCLDNAAAYIRGYGYDKLYTSFDQTQNGQQATRACTFLAATEPDLQHILMS